MAESERKKLVTSDATVAQNTDMLGEKPMSMNTTMEMSEKKWNQYRLVKTHALSMLSILCSLMLYLRASMVTMTNKPK